MKLEEYLTRYRLLLHGAEKEERMLELMEGKPYQAFLRHFRSSKDPSLSRFLLTEQALRARLTRKKRLAERYASRLARACAMIPTPELREYAVCHYLYGMTHEDIAERSQFCVRTVYRHAREAKKQLEAMLLQIMPKAKRIPPARFSVRGNFSIRAYAVDRISRSVAAVTARKRLAAPITSGSFFRESKPAEGPLFSKPLLAF